jgi:hypothetical protein
MEITVLWTIFVILNLDDPLKIIFENEHTN